MLARSLWTSGLVRSRNETDNNSDMYSNSSDSRVVVIWLLNNVVITCVVEGV